MSLAAQVFTSWCRRGALAIALALTVSLISLAVGLSGPPARPMLDIRPIQLHWDSDDGGSQPGSMSNIARQVGAPAFWANGYTGAGVDVAIIDSGVAPVAGLDEPGKVVYGPDVSFESDVAERHNLDTFGHGTHMAGIIAGNSATFSGIAPGARVVSLKAADALGRTSVGQVIAAIKWVVDNRTAGGLNIRVLNLSFGAQAVQPYQHDDLAFAVEQAWKAGIAVIASAGNGGTASGGLSNPAYDPFVIAVGADNTQGTLGISDDTVTAFSSRGDGVRNPDLIAPGMSVVSLRVPGSYLDLTHPDARVGEAYFRGSGTSQAAAVVAGTAALVLQQRPAINPDRLKQILVASAKSIPGATVEAQGAGLIDLASAPAVSAPRSAQPWTWSVGSDGNSWSSADATGNSWSTAEASGNSWSTNDWTGSGWEGEGWNSDPAPDGNSWSSDGWVGVSWGKPKGGRLAVINTTCEWIYDNYGVSWGKKPRLSNACKSLFRENGVSWGRRPKFAKPHDDPLLERYGVSWGRRALIGTTPQLPRPSGMFFTAGRFGLAVD